MSAAWCDGETNGGDSWGTEHTRPSRCRGGVEAAGRGGAGKRAVRQRDPTWALRCPAFPSLKYYSVRREREPRSPASPRRRFHATSNALSPPPRHGPRIVRVYRGVGRGREVGFFSAGWTATLVNEDYQQVRAACATEENGVAQRGSVFPRSAWLVLGLVPCPLARLWRVARNPKETNGTKRKEGNIRLSYHSTQQRTDYNHEHRHTEFAWITVERIGEPEICREQRMTGCSGRQILYLLFCGVLDNECRSVGTCSNLKG